MNLKKEQIPTLHSVVIILLSFLIGTIVGYLLYGLQTFNLSEGMLALIGVVLGAVLSYILQYFLYRYQMKGDIQRKAIDLKNSQCLNLWKAFSDMRQYLFPPGEYSEHKIDFVELEKHYKKIIVAICNAGLLFISNKEIKELFKVKDILDDLFEVRDSGEPTDYEEYAGFLYTIELQINKAQGILQDKLNLIEFGILRE